MRSVLLMAIFILPSILSGCFGEDLQDLTFEMGEDDYLEPWERYGSDTVYDDTDVYSRVTEKGAYGYSETGQSVFIQYLALRLQMVGQVQQAVQSSTSVFGFLSSKDVIIPRVTI